MRLVENKRQKNKIKLKENYTRNGRQKGVRDTADKIMQTSCKEQTLRERRKKLNTEPGNKKLK